MSDNAPAQQGPERSNANRPNQGTRWDEIYRRLAAVQQRIDQAGALSPEQQQVILKARAQQMAQEPRPALPLATGEDDAALEMIQFRMAHETYGFETRYIREVYPLRDVCPLPCTPAFVLGLVNVRGQILSVLDLKRFFGLASEELDNHSQIIILRHQVTPDSAVMEVGVLADSLLNVSVVMRDTLQPALPTLTGLRQEFLLGITPARVIVLDAEKLLASREIIVHEEVEL